MGELGSWKHCMDECPKTRHAPERHYTTGPTVLWTHPCALTFRKSAVQICGRPPSEGEPQRVGTDGSSTPCIIGRRGSRGAHDPRNQWGSVARPVQTAARVEEYAVLQALTSTVTPFVVVTDCVDVYEQAKRLRNGGEVSGRHADLWHAATQYFHKVNDVVLVKAHLDADEALQSSEVGYPEHRHDLNERAAALGGRGAEHMDVGVGVGVGRAVVASPQTRTVSLAGVGETQQAGLIS